ncbi:hypothetical protein Daesc_009664 [Daldinia eschscholtzii]|uniref:Aminoglycoside phosphotransferase domain-containing protein n=1 Tax=Daldinia eschscholtzii TaxID=292717 RepID=A0AAX6MBM1_9PEZI
MFAAFLSSTHEDFLEAHEAITSNQHPPESNLWLIRSSAARAFSEGFFRVKILDRMRIYRRTNSFKVHRLPFGMYLKESSKEWHTSLSNEYETLNMLRRQTDIPVARPLDLVSDGKRSYLVTSRVPGKPIGLCIDFLNNEQLRIFAHDLWYCLQKLRTLQKDPILRSTISNTVGKACYDGRIVSAIVYDETRGDFVGPFSAEAEFNKILRSPHIPDIVHRDGHKIVFTHGDINLRNVLVDEKSGRLSGIVDWETAGWYPDYWEYTKAHFSTRLKWRWLKDVIEVVFKDFGDFSEDLEIERKLWWYCW